MNTNETFTVSGNCHSHEFNSRVSIKYSIRALLSIRGVKLHTLKVMAKPANVYGVDPQLTSKFDGIYSIDDGYGWAYNGHTQYQTRKFIEVVVLDGKLMKRAEAEDYATDLGFKLSDLL